MTEPLFVLPAPAQPRDEIEQKQAADAIDAQREGETEAERDAQREKDEKEKQKEKENQGDAQNLLIVTESVPRISLSKANERGYLRTRAAFLLLNQSRRVFGRSDSKRNEDDVRSKYLSATPTKSQRKTTFRYKHMTSALFMLSVTCAHVFWSVLLKAIFAFPWTSSTSSS